MSQRERLLAGLLLAAFVAALVWMAFGFDWSNEGGQYRRIGEQLSHRRGGVNAGNYKSVANSRTKEYWPNSPGYSSSIPAGDRVFILDDDALSDFKGYHRGSN